MALCSARHATRRLAAAAALRRPAHDISFRNVNTARRAIATATTAQQESRLQFGAHVEPRPAHTLLADIDLLVLDMAGTTVEEGGLVYKTLRHAIEDEGLACTEKDMRPWHGAKKEAVIEHFATRAGVAPGAALDACVRRVGAHFEEQIELAYFRPDSPVRPIDAGLFPWLAALRAGGVQVALDTGYPPAIQRGLMEKLGLDAATDAAVSAYQVAQGRPYPYMIFRAMEKCNVMDVGRVAKAGDSVRDVEEGRNAGCGLVVGVLSGADGAEALLAAGADVVVPRITDLPAVPQEAAQAQG